MNFSIASQLKRFFSRYPLKTYRKQERLVRPEEIVPGIFFIKSGFVRQSAISREGKELTLNIFKPESLLFFVLTLENRKSGYSYEAMTHTQAYCAPFDETENFLLDRPQFMLKLLRRVGYGISTFNDRMESLAFSNAQGKLASTLLILAQRFGVKDNGLIQIPLPLTHSDIANLVGLTRETTSIEMKILEKKMVIARKKKQIRILNMPEVQRMASIEAKWI